MAKIVIQPRPFVPTDKQIQALAARAAGGSRKEAAKLLGWTDGAVAYHLRKLELGMHFADDAQAVFGMWQQIAVLIASHAETE